MFVLGSPIHEDFQQFFTAGNNFYDFLFAFLYTEAIWKWGLCQEGMKLLQRSRFFPLSVDPVEKGGRVYLTELPPLQINLFPVISDHSFLCTFSWSLPWESLSLAFSNQGRYKSTCGSIQFESVARHDSLGFLKAAWVQGRFLSDKLHRLIWTFPGFTLSPMRLTYLVWLES